MEDKRSFTIINVVGKSSKNLGGRFISRTPSGAAKKAAKRVCKMNKIKGQCSFVVHIQETTQGSKKKIYKYNVKKTPTSKSVVRDGVKISFKYKVVAKSLKK